MNHVFKFSQNVVLNHAVSILFLFHPFSTGITFIKVDVDENSETAEAQGISAMPTFKFFKDGQEASELVGASEQKLKEELQKLKDA